MTEKKAQAWGLDLMIALVIVSIAVFSFLFFIVNHTNETKEEFRGISYDAEFIADSLMSPGMPVNWSEGNVVSIGIVDGGRINESKLENFYNLAENDYNKTRRTFKTAYDYLFTLEGNFSINSTNVSGIGKPGSDANNLTGDNVAAVKRVIIYQDRIATAKIYVWD